MFIFVKYCYKIKQKTSQQELILILVKTVKHKKIFWILKKNIHKEIKNNKLKIRHRFNKTKIINQDLLI